MLEYKGWIVRSIAGRDKGQLFCVVDTEANGLLLCDGKGRPVERPKRKKYRHVAPLQGPQHPSTHPAIQKLNEGKGPTNRELRQALAAFRDEEARKGQESPT